MQKQNKPNKYKLIVTLNNKQIEYLGSWSKLETAIKRYEEKIEENKKIIFPAKLINTKAIKDAKYKLVLLKRRENNEENNFLHRNDYGEYVEHETDSQDWLVYSIANYEIEENFWVYGFHPFKQRKNFTFIYNTFVKDKVKNKYDFLSILLFKNKIIFETYNKFEMVICKNKSDAIRMYNLIEEKIQKDKIKNVLFCGDGESDLKRKKETVEKIEKFTNWNHKKILRASTRP